MQAAREAQLAYNDQAAAYNWDLSAKTQDDLREYLDYLQKRQKETGDPSKALTIQSKMVDARRTYTSKEIGRQTINVLYGDIDNRQKYAVINNLMNQAAEVGDASLFQQLDETRARLSKTIQDEQIAAANRAAGAAKTSASNSLTQVQRKLRAVEDAVELAYRTGKPISNLDGSPIKGFIDKQGNFTPDPNGKPVRLDDRSYAQTLGLTLKQKADALRQYVASGNDESGAKESELSDLLKSPKYRTYANDTLLERYNREGGGEDPYVTEVDPVTGDRQRVRKNLVSMDPLGLNLPIDQRTTLNKYETGFQHDQHGKPTGKYIFSASTGAEAGGLIDDFQVTPKPQNTDTLPTVRTEDGRVVKGYGTQSYFIHPVKKTKVYLAPENAGKGSLLRSTEPLKVIDKDKDGKPIYGVVEKDDYLRHDGGVAQFVDDWKTGIGVAGDKVAGALKDVTNVTNNIANATSKIGLVTPFNALGSVLNMFHFGQNKRAAEKRARQAAAVKAAQDAAQRRAIDEANRKLAEAQAQAAAANAAHPSILYAKPGVGTNANPGIQQLGGPRAPIGSNAFNNAIWGKWWKL